MVAVLGILAAIAIVRYQALIRKSEEGTTRGNLGKMRSALSIYYGDNQSRYPQDDLQSLTAGQKYLRELPEVKRASPHLASRAVTTEAAPTDTGSWSYDHDPASPGWGHIAVGCLHSDLKGNLWSSY